MSFCMTSIAAQKLVSVSEAIELALENNYGIKIISNNKEIAKNNASVLNSGYLPTVTSSSGATFNRDNLEAEFANGESTALNGAKSSRYNASINLNYTLFDGLGRYYDYKRLKETYKLSELQARETIENTIAQLYVVYYNVAQVTENVTVLEKTLTISKDRITRASYQFEYGQGTMLNVLNAQVDINNDSINLINAKQQLVNTKRDLNVVLGNVISSEFRVDTTIDFKLDIDQNDLATKVKSNNVNLLQLDKNIMINTFIVKANKSGYLPSLGLTGSYGWNKGNNNAASFVAVSTNTGLSGGLSLSWNLFDGGATATRVSNAKIELENRSLEKESMLIDIERNFNNAWDDYQNKLTIFQVQENNIITSTNNFNRTQEKYKLGQATSIEFRQAQLNLINSELNRNQAKYAAKIAELTVLQLSGELLNIEF
ncbi:TolC family protein [Flavobacteriaceae bacterium]|nr:TolC family protein [Flavobacteriaceae bacterium]MDB9780319.1 TolC family protein [Flavobacteriaceae bacterium]